MVMMKIETLHNITGVFKSCTIEPGIHGWSVFDAKKRFVCLITTNGVALSDEYEHSEDLSRKLAGEKITFWSLEISEKLTEQELQDELQKVIDEIEKNKPIKKSDSEILYEEPPSPPEHKPKAPPVHAVGMDDESPF
jgi:hypothetical protein